ncbi:YbaB/EbfC family nucleoid-associated protein [Nocardia sp. NPDC024068]|uniref:YbaB/EbfC family nucleoid-associated protein n=1 Tax=Nocardia sp. NPDC024068 TaxID=3157197 RepID=UPI0033F30537
MDEWERSGLRSANYGMRNQLDRMLDTLSEQQQRMGEIQAELAAARVTAQSPDGAVEVTVDSSGALVDVRFTDAARRHGLDRLRDCVMQAYAEAARRSREQTSALIAPLAEAAELSPDLPDLVPGAPTLRGAPGAESDPRTS